MKAVFRRLALVFMMAFLMSAIAAFGAPTKLNGIDISKEVNLNVYVMGPAEKDMDLMIAELNKMTKRDLNCTVKFNNINWDDWANKYSLALASGESIDLMFTSNWCLFNQETQKGAFLPLDDLIAKVVPKMLNDMPKEDWKEATRNGKIYMMPDTLRETVSWGLLYREDLRKKYKLAEVKDFASMEAYFDGIKKNEKTIWPLNMGNNEMFSWFINNRYSWDTIGPAGADLLYMKKDQKNIRDLGIWVNTPDFANFCKDMKRWADKEFWSRSALNNKVGTEDAFDEGTSAGCITQNVYLNRVCSAAKAKNPSAEFNFFPYVKLSGLAISSPATQGGMAIPASALYPERALLLLDKLRNDEAYFDLTVYGIRGKNYDFDANGRYILPKGVSADNNGYNIWGGGTGWGWRMAKFIRNKADDWDIYIKADKEIKAFAMKSKLLGFSLDEQPIKAESDAIKQVIAEYSLPLFYGALDPAKYVPEYREKLKSAGIERVLAEVKKQVSAYADANGY